MISVVSAVLLVGLVTADPFIYNVYSSSGASQSPFGNPYTRDEVYIRRPSVGSNPYYTGMGNQMMMMGGAGGLQGLQGMQGMQAMQIPYGASSMGMGGLPDSYGSSMYKPRFAASNMMMGQPLVLNGYPMYPKTSGYPMVVPMGMGSFGSSPTVYQGPTVSRLPFQTAKRHAVYF